MACDLHFHTHLAAFFVCFVLVLTETTTESPADEPTGHLKPLGQHMSPIGGVDIIDEFQDPSSFYEVYTKVGKPVLFRQVLENITFPAYNLWTDENLSKKYGEETVNVEMSKKEDVGGKKQTMPLSEFIRRYNDEDIHMVQGEKASMAGDVMVPGCLQCGGFQHKILSSFMTFSNGGTKSVLRTHEYENILCLLDGESYIVLINKKYKDQVEGSHWHTDGSYSGVDVEMVDLHQFPYLKNVPWYEVHMNKGDCLFIPYMWYYHLATKEGRNFAVGIRFRHIEEFNENDCDNYDPDDLLPKSMLYQKRKRDFDYRKFLSQDFEKNNEVKEEDFIFNYVDDDDHENSKEEIKKFFRFLDTNNDTVLSQEELLTFDIDLAHQNFPDTMSFLEELGHDEEQDAKLDEKHDSDFHDNKHDEL